MAVARTVVIEPAAKEYLEQEEQKDPLLRNVVRALEWRLARQPEIGYRVPGFTPPRYLVRSQPYRLPVPRFLRLLYRYTEDEVVIEFAQVETAGEADER
ncbi:MAG TPA: hypothetical protein VNK46_12840 [Nitrospiraceae bacterium]|jgi:plasmid stabilization system protein ParE|nr:hypothetical protein [Nitrospiraceae bacterium]